MNKKSLVALLSAPLLWAQDFLLPWGSVSIDNPALTEMIAHPAMERLKHIDQSGPVTYLGLMPKFSRFEHSIGVLALLQDKAHATFEEQLAGLFHDSSHSAFSHIADHLFHTAHSEHSYQDTIHLNFLHALGVDKNSERFGVTLAALDPDKPEYRALEQSLPDLCADRIEYLLHTASKLHYLSTEEITAIVADLQFEQGRWFFQDRVLAEKFAHLSTHFTKEIYASSWNTGIYEVFASILKEALAEGALSKEQICYGSDQAVLEALSTSGSASLQARLKAFQQDPTSCYHLTMDHNNAELWVTPKFRGVDPWVRSPSGEFQRLTEISETYRQEYLFVKDWCARGYGLIFKTQDV